MIDSEDIEVAGGLRCCGDREALLLKHVACVRSLRQCSADLAALPDSAPLDRYFPLVIALENAVRNANQAHVNLHGHKC
jgi:hypothetical protein